MGPMNNYGKEAPGMRFDDSFRTTVPTHDLIRNYQVLAVAARDFNDGNTSQEELLDAIYGVMKDLNRIIMADSAGNTDVVPTGHSIVMPEIAQGLYLTERGQELRCAGGRPVSEAVHYECQGCPHWKERDCWTYRFRTRLENGLRYDGCEGSNKALRAMEGDG